MSPMEAVPAVEDDVVADEYSFAMEYNGPPLNFTIPRALPIHLDRISVASVVADVPLSDKMSFPVVKPLLPPDNLNFSKDPIKAPPDTNVSPTSVIDFDRSVGALKVEEAELASELSLSPRSLAASGNIDKSGPDCSIQESNCSGTIDFSNEFSNGSRVSDVTLKTTSEEVIGSTSVSCQHSQDLSLSLSLGGAGSSRTLDFCQGFDKSRELAGSSLRTLRDSISFHGGDTDFDEMNLPDWASMHSAVSMDDSSSLVSSFRTGECNSVSHGDTKKANAAIFPDLDSIDGADEDPEYPEVQTVVKQRTRETQVKSRKGACYRCSKGNRFTEKEACIVCNAKYCGSCVLRAMGSMPEGRKCVTCIGYPIEESKRGALGKCSRMLKRLLNELEIRQIMKAEKFCDANQLPAEYICVNGKALCPEELVLLQSCSTPPKNLKPGKYWYDKVSGLWGKEGQKPSQIISPHLNVGDAIKPNASDGNTQVFINGREITKVELRMLQLAGVQCAGNPHFWVNEDGSYQEEGQKNTKGYIWGKAGTKLVCAFLSLPVPSKSRQSRGEQLDYVPCRSIPNYIEEKMIQKLLLIGCSGSGTSTIFKQAKILYKATPFSEEEKEKIKFMIQSNVYSYLGVLLEGRERFEEESWSHLGGKQSSDGCDCLDNADGSDRNTIYSICPRLKSFSDWLLKTMVSGNLEAIFPAATREYAPLIEELWNSAAMQATYSRRSELEMLPIIASYFLERAVEILKADYEPSDLDILYAEGVTSSNGLACVDFSFPPSTPDEDTEASDQYDHLLRYQLIRMQARGGLVESCKWLEMFEDVRLVMFCVSLSDYDLFVTDDEGVSTNKMLLSKKFFESIVTHPTFEQMEFLLVLNKCDLFEQKVDLERVPLSQCEWFEDFQPVISRQTNKNSNIKSINYNPSLGQLAAHYVGVKFKRLFSNLTGGRKLYVSLARALEPSSVDEALKYSREILKWEEERVNFCLSDYSAYSAEDSSPSH